MAAPDRLQQSVKRVQSRVFTSFKAGR